MFKVFDSSLTSKPSRDLYFPAPIFTSHIRLLIVEASPHINVKFDFIGMTGEKMYSRERFMEDGYFDRGAEFRRRKRDLMGGDSFLLSFSSYVRRD